MSAALYTDFTFASSVVLTALGCVLLGIVRIPSDRDPAAAGKLRTAMIIVGDSDGTSRAVWPTAGDIKSTGPILTRL
ncbi:hypothetical protein [Alistipes sp.]|uniref:hypothetical protein n=1 Tax=Alistipes sp. TaxID=1872444 RepID=UPI003AB5FAB9